VTEFETIRYQRQGDVGTLTLARPAKRNAQNPLMWQEMAQLAGVLLPDETLRCLVITGEGPSFSAGLDLVEGMAGALAEWSQLPADEIDRDQAMAAATTFNWIPRLGCPSVAAVRGHALGAGLQLALACDFRIFAESAKAGLPETRYGILPDMGATVRLPRIIGDSRARELIVMGTIIDAGEALRIGLANRVVPDEDLDAAAAGFAARLAAQPPLAVHGARRAIDAGWEGGAAESFRVAVEAQLRCITSEDFKEGLQALAEGRTPVWRGR
jgi:enoyl-CoA hydratase/carnithine racemase